MIWPFPLIRWCPTSPRLSEIFLEFADSEELRVKQTREWVTLHCRLGTLSFRAQGNSAFGDVGEFTLTNSDTEYWGGVMPSRWAVRAVRLAIEQCNITSEVTA